MEINNDEINQIDFFRKSYVYGCNFEKLYFIKKIIVPLQITQLLFEKFFYKNHCLLF